MNMTTKEFEIASSEVAFTFRVSHDNECNCGVAHVKVLKSLEIDEEGMGYFSLEIIDTRAKLKILHPSDTSYLTMEFESNSRRLRESSMYRSRICHVKLVKVDPELKTVDVTCKICDLNWQQYATDATISLSPGVQSTPRVIVPCTNNTPKGDIAKVPRKYYRCFLNMVFSSDNVDIHMNIVEWVAVYRLAKYYSATEVMSRLMNGLMSGKAETKFRVIAATYILSQTPLFEHMTSKQLMSYLGL
jgi:hypothetical protein